MRKIFSMFVFILLLTTIMAVAQEETTEENAGVTPDSIWWGIDVALDKIALALTFDNEARAEKGLKIAEERLLEIKIMATEKKIKAMAKAETEHGKVVVKIKEDIEKLEEDDLTEEIKTVIKLEKKIGKHEANLEEIRQKIDIKIKGELTEEQQAMIDSVLSNLEGQTGELKIKVINKKDKTEIKIKVKTGKSETEIEKEVEDIEDAIGLTRDRTVWAQKAIDHAEEKIARAEEKINEKISEGENVTVALDFLEQAKEMLAQAKEKLNATEYREARKLAKDAGKLAMHAKRGKSFDEIEEKLEIKGTLTEEQQALVDEIFAKVKEGNVKVEIKIKVKWEEESNTTIVERKEIEGEVSDEVQGLINTLVESLQGTVNEENEEVEVEVEFEPEEEVECITHEECKIGEICVDGECEKVKEPECVEDADCKEDEVCIEGECEEVEEEEEIECTTDADCKEGEICTDAECEKVKEEKEPECVVDADCKEDETCVEGKCEEKEE
ncbi:MAG: DUF5667 domain-containing protein [Nanoarchaeota archaeon]|nr:DUF5667 domain-containing protein [Nanoarchaeota archaeon]